MTISIIQAVGAISLVTVTMAAIPMCKSDSSTAESALSASTAASAAPAATGGSGLPSDFPLPPGLSACKPIIIGPEVKCDWSNINGHEMFTFFRAALPKAGYTVDSAVETPSGRYMGAVKFEKGKVIGTIFIPNTDLEIALFTRP